MVGGEMSITDFACTGNQAVGEGLCPSRAVSRGKIECTDANTHAPVGADDPVRPAARTYEHGRTNANPHTVCRGRCRALPARRTSVFTKRRGKFAVAPTGGQRRPPLQNVFRFRRWRVQFSDCVLPGRCDARRLVSRRSRAQRGS